MQARLFDMPDWQKRDFHGFAQYKMIDGNWQFQVYSFSSDDRHCDVLLTDGGRRQVRIDGKDRILIHGKWYGRKHWNH